MLPSRFCNHAVGRWTWVANHSSLTGVCIHVEREMPTCASRRCITSTFKYKTPVSHRMHCKMTPADPEAQRITTSLRWSSIPKHLHIVELSPEMLSLIRTILFPNRCWPFGEHWDMWSNCASWTRRSVEASKRLVFLMSSASVCFFINVFFVSDYSLNGFFMWHFVC